MNKPYQQSKTAVLTRPIFNRLIATFFLVLAFAITQPVWAVSPLVSAAWLQDNLSQPNIAIIDLQPTQGYDRVHLPNAVNSQYEQWRQRKAVEGKALPDIAYLEKLLGSLGIANDSHVILTPIGANASEVAVATRIYWSLKVLGHKDVSILDGGLIAYSQLPNARFSNAKPSIQPANYKAIPDLSMVPTANDVLSELKNGTSFVDYRSEGEFFGKVGGPRPGTIPGSKNLPYDLLLEKGQGGQFLPKNRIKLLYASRGISNAGPQIGFCNSGHRASLAWFVSHEIMGNKQARLFDGSMAEWSQHQDYPISIPKCSRKDC